MKIEIHVAEYAGKLAFKTGQTMFNCLHDDGRMDGGRLEVWRGDKLIDHAKMIPWERTGITCFVGMKLTHTTGHLRPHLFCEGDLLVLNDCRELRTDFETSLRSCFLFHNPTLTEDRLPPVLKVCAL